MPAPTDAKRGRTVDSLFCGKATAGQTVHRTVCLDRPFESTRPHTANKNIGPANGGTDILACPTEIDTAEKPSVFKGLRHFYLPQIEKSALTFEPPRKKLQSYVRPK